MTAVWLILLVLLIAVASVSVVFAPAGKRPLVVATAGVAMFLGGALLIYAITLPDRQAEHACHAAGYVWLSHESECIRGVEVVHP